MSSEGSTEENTSSAAARVALFGGSFNPPHIGHVMTVSYLLGCGDVDEVWLSPTWDHAWGKELAPWDDRVAMLEAALSIFDDRVIISDIERQLGGESRTIRVVDAILAETPGVEIVLVVGSDILDELDRWLEVDRLLRTVELRVLHRGGYHADDPRVVGPRLPEVSSTEVRRLLAQSRWDEATECVPQPVVDYARAHQLYCQAHGQARGTAAKSQEPGEKRTSSKGASTGLSPGDSSGADAPPPTTATTRRRDDSTTGWEAPRVAIVGAGRAGVALGASLSAAGWPISLCWSRDQTRANDAARRLSSPHARWGALPDRMPPSDVVLVTVVDDAIAETAHALAGEIARLDAVALHSSGSRSSEVLVEAGIPARLAGSLHPLVALPDARKVGTRVAADRLTGAFMVLEGSERASESARAIALATGATPVEMGPDGDAKVRYHAGAVVASNYVVTLFAAAHSLLVEAGIDANTAQAMLHGLLESTSENLGAMSAAEALTGPVRRGDHDTVRRHLKALEARGAGWVSGLYAALLEPTIQLARTAGLDETAAKRLRGLMS